MSSVKSLLQTALVKGKRAEAAREELDQEGLKIVPILLREIRGSTGKKLHLIRDILLRIRDPRIVLAVGGSLSSKDFDEWKIAFDVLSNPELKSGFDALVAQLIDPKNSESKRDQAAAALAELGDSRAIESLSEAVANAHNSGLHLLVISGSVALARLGNNEFESLVTSLARPSVDPTIRVHAVKALKYFASQDVLKTLVDALQDQDLEICGDSTDGLFFLGSRDVVPLFFERAKQADSVTTQHLRRRLSDLICRSNQETLQELTSLWQSKGASFHAGVCYRLGEPISLPSILGVFEREPRERRSILEELWIITGQRFGLHPHRIPSDQEVNGLAKVIASWVEQNGTKFESGKLYKFGFQKAVPTLG